MRRRRPPGAVDGEKPVPVVVREPVHRAVAGGERAEVARCVVGVPSPLAARPDQGGDPTCAVTVDRDRGPFGVHARLVEDELVVQAVSDGAHAVVPVDEQDGAVLGGQPEHLRVVHLAGEETTQRSGAQREHR